MEKSMLVNHPAYIVSPEKKTNGKTQNDNINRELIKSQNNIK